MGSHTGFWGYSHHIVTKTSERLHYLQCAFTYMLSFDLQNNVCDGESCVNIATEALRE